LGCPSLRINDGDSVYGNTALHHVASKGHIPCLTALLKSGRVQINIRNVNGYTPLHLAVTFKQKEAVALLIEAGADLETRNNNNKTPLEDAIDLGAKEIAQLIKTTHINRCMDHLRKKDLEKWTSHDVAKWISLLNFQQYANNFVSNDITGASLKTLSLSNLKNELNIQSFGHRATIMENIKKLLKEAQKAKETPPPSPAPSPQKNQTNENGTTNGHTSHEMENDISLWNIDYSSLEMKELLGKGFFGEVRRAVWKGTDVAVKVIYRDSFGSQKDLDMFYKELSIVSKLRHPNIIFFIGACMEGNNRCMVTEYLSGGNVHALIHNNWDTLERNPTLRHRIVSDVIKGMTYLHDMKILHRDLTPKNLLLDTNMNCKLCDFGLSRITQETGEMTTSLGCLPYQAPEVFKGERYTPAADVFSFGMVVYELVSGQEPQKEIQPLKFANMVAHEGYRPPMPACSPKWQNLITTCWDSDPTKRPTFKELLTTVGVNITEPSSRLDAVVDSASFNYAVGAYTE